MNEQQGKAKHLVEKFLDDCTKGGAVSAIAGVSYRDGDHDNWWVSYRGSCLTVVGLVTELQATMSIAMRLTATNLAEAP